MRIVWVAAAAPIYGKICMSVSADIHFFINFKVDKSKSMQAKVMLSAGLFSEYRYCHSSLKDAEQASSCLSSFERPANQCTRVRARINSSVCKDQRRKKT